MDCSPLGSSVHGILQVRILEWVVMPSSRRSSQPRDQTCLFHLLHWQVCPSPLAPPGKPRYLGCTCKRVHEYLCVEYFVLWRRYLMDIWNQKMMIFFHYKREEPQWLPFIRPNKAPSSHTRLIIFLQIQKKKMEFQYINHWIFIVHGNMNLKEL